MPWRSVVGKLWITILLLVLFVLSFLTILITGYFETYYEKDTENKVIESGEQIVKMLQEDTPDEVLYNFSQKLIINQARITLVKEDGTIWSTGDTNLIHLTLDQVKSDPDLSRVFTEHKRVVTRLNGSKGFFSSLNPSGELVVGMPVETVGSEAVFIQHSLQEVAATTDNMIKFVFLSAGFAIVLTTIFGFFLSTRITAPLIQMKEVATEVARGKYDATIPITSKDEIGDLVRTFNQMGENLKFNIHALKQEKEQLSSILSSMADGVITLSQNSEIILTNPPADYFMKTWFQEKGESVRYNSVLPDELAQLFSTVVETESPQIAELNMAKSSWTVIMTPLYNNEMSIRGAVAVLRDTTEERRLNKMRGDFIANVSHELRTPMVMLQGYSEAILDGIASTEEEQRELVQIINDESLRLGRLVNELLDLARMESENLQLTIESIHIEDFIERITRKFQGIATERNVTMVADYVTTTTSHSFDCDRMEQVLTNLLDNAIRHTPDGGTVTLIVKQSSNGLQLAIQDTGTGIPEEDLPFVFERFYKADKARTRGRAGTGLGLAIVKNIVDAHHGTISVASIYGEGTTFTLVIPTQV